MHTTESSGEHGEQHEHFAREIRQALSPAFPKSVQELLPGYLPDKPFSELTPEEQSAYHAAYHLLGEMEERGEVDTVFVEERLVEVPDMTQELHRPKFVLHTNHGTRVPASPAFEGGSPAPSPVW